MNGNHGDTVVNQDAQTTGSKPVTITSKKEKKNRNWKIFNQIQTTTNVGE